MTHYLHLLRHAQSADKQPGQSDLLRILKREGEEEARRVGNYLKEHKQIPDLVLTSPAQRALSTAANVCYLIPDTADFIQKMDGLYEAGAAQYLKMISSLNPTVNRVLIVGHNPGISEAVEVLTGENIELRPCELATIQFAGPWPEVSRNSGKLFELLHPSRQIESR